MAAGYRHNYQSAGKDTTVESTPVDVPILPERKPSAAPPPAVKRRPSTHSAEPARTSGSRQVTRSRPRSSGNKGNNSALLLLAVVIVLALLIFLLIGEGGVTFERTIDK